MVPAFLAVSSVANAEKGCERPNGDVMRQDSDYVATIIYKFVETVLAPANLKVQDIANRANQKKNISWEKNIRDKLKKVDKSAVLDVQSAQGFKAGWLGCNNKDTDLCWQDHDNSGSWYIEIKYIHDNDSASNAKNAFVQQVENALRYGHENLIVLIVDGREKATGCALLDGHRRNLDFADLARKFRDFVRCVYGFQMWTIYGCRKKGDKEGFKWYVVQ